MRDRSRSTSPDDCDPSIRDSYVITVTHQCAIHTQTYHRLRLVRDPGEAAFSYKKFQDNKIRDAFGIPDSVPFVLTYKVRDYDQDVITIATDDDLETAINYASHHFRVIIYEDSAINNKCPIISTNFACYTVEVYQRTVVHHMNLYPGQPRFSLEQFQSDIRSVFKLPQSSHFVITYQSSSDARRVSGWSRSEGRITIANTEELRHFLVNVGREGLRCCVPLAIQPTDVDPSKTLNGTMSPNYLKVQYYNSFRRLILPPGMLKFSYQQLETCIRNLFNLHVSTQFELSYFDDVREHITIARNEEVNHILAMLSLHRYPLQLDIDGSEDFNGRTVRCAARDVKIASYIAKIHYDDTCRRLTLEPGYNQQFSYKELENRIRALFKIRLSEQCLMDYIDKQGDRIILAEDADLKDALIVQSLNPLEVDVTTIERPQTSNGV